MVLQEPAEILLSFNTSDSNIIIIYILYYYCYPIAFVFNSCSNIKENER